MTAEWPSSASQPAAATEAGPAPMSATDLPVAAFFGATSFESGTSASAVSVA